MAQAEPKIGQKIGNFEIVRELGHGAMGIVYKANQGTMNRFVALKVLSGALAGDQAYIRRFHREARAAARLNHPNIITIHDQGEAAGFHYIVTEYVTGTTLTTHIKMRGQLDASSALDIVLQAAEALEAAHSQEIVHRDIKPDNVMINGAGRVKVMDFGIAKLSGATAITREGQMLGTPYYMSPEQYGDSTSVDARSDLYSLGVVMFEMLAGQVPFEADSIPSLCYKITNDPLPSLRALNSDVPEDISDIVKKLTAKHPGNRYQSATDLIADIKAWKRQQYRPVKTDAAKSNRPTVPAAQVNAPTETRAMIPDSRSRETAGPLEITWNATDKDALLALPGNVDMEFVWIPPGEFMMGSPSNEEGRGDDETQHRVTLTKGVLAGEVRSDAAAVGSANGEQPFKFQG